MRALTFSAILLDTGELTLEPGFVVEGEVLRADGDLTVEALSRGGEVLATTHVPLGVPCAYPSATPMAERSAQVAVGLVDFPERATGLRAILDGRTLLERSTPRKSGKPSVEWPSSLPADTVSVGWRHAFKGAIASLGYTNDDGKTWSPVALPTSDEKISFDGGILPGGKQCMLELTVTDGFRTTSLRSPEYAVDPKGWVLWILSPAAGSALASGASVMLAAQGYQLEERRPGFDEITWVSSRDGGLGVGAQVLAALSPGQHTITAMMFGISSEVSVTVTQ